MVGELYVIEDGEPVKVGDVVHVRFTSSEPVYYIPCARCARRARLVAGYCDQCEPDLHAKWAAARATVNADDNVTPETMTAFVELARVKAS